MALGQERSIYKSRTRERRGMSTPRKIVSVYSEKEILTVLKSEIKLTLTSMGKNLTQRK